MKYLSHYATLFLLSIFFLSCVDESIEMYYHPEKEPEYYWLLEKVAYPESNFEILARKDFTLSYDKNDSLKKIDILNGDYIAVDYNENTVSFSKVDQRGDDVLFDSILVALNNKKQAEYILHLCYIEKKTESGYSKYKSIDDSLALFYDNEGYITRLESYSVSGKPSSLRYTETYKTDNGNLVEVVSKNKKNTYKYIYTYDETSSDSRAVFCCEMPFNNTMMHVTNNCWLMKNLPFLSKYLGTKSKNNIIRTRIIDQSSNNEKLYAEINYDYSFNKNKLVNQIKVSGIINGSTIPNDYITTFTYLQKEKK